MTQQVILEQIDVMVVGPKKFQFLSLILQKQFQYNQPLFSSQSKNQQHQTQSYIRILKGFFNLSTSAPQNTVNGQIVKSSTPLPISPFKQLSDNCQQTQQYYTSLDDQGASLPQGFKTFCGIHKFTKMIQTQTFWITINFYVTDLKIYDPILSEYTRGNVQMGIFVADDESQQMDEFKTYLSGGSQTIGSVFQVIRQPQKNSRAQSTMQAKINSRIHNPSVSGFTSLLCLRLRDQYRLIQESNNLRLTNNQIFRWVVDRYFQNKYRIKLKQSLGDQIERGPLKKQQPKTSACEIM